MEKTLIVVSHPSIETSIINKSWIEEAKKHPEKFTVHELYNTYPDWQINIEKEQALIEAHSGLVLQFPLYWFNCPPLLKKWLDDVFTYGWAYGSTGTKLKNRKMGIAVSAGITKKDFAEHGRLGITIQEILRPLELTAKYTQADYQPIFAFYGAISEPGMEPGYTKEEFEQSSLDYIEYLKRFM